MTIFSVKGIFFNTLVDYLLDPSLFLLTISATHFRHLFGPLTNLPMGFFTKIALDVCPRNSLIFWVSPIVKKPPIQVMVINRLIRKVVRDSGFEEFFDTKGGYPKIL